MAVELWNGATWTVLKTYTNSGNIPWTSENLDISSQTHNPAFKIRFHAAGLILMISTTGTLTTLRSTAPTEQADQTPA
jgi:hypothetical protein